MYTGFRRSSNLAAAQAGGFERFDGLVFGWQARRSGPSVGQQSMPTLQVEGQAHQAPFASGGNQAPQRELAKAQDLFDDPDHRFDGTLPQAIDRLPDGGLKFVSHLDLRTGLF